MHCPVNKLCDSLCLFCGQQENPDVAGAGPLKWMTFSWLVSLFFDCPEGYGLHCPDAEAQVSSPRRFSSKRRLAGRQAASYPFCLRRCPSPDLDCDGWFGPARQLLKTRFARKTLCGRHSRTMASWQLSMPLIFLSGCVRASSWLATTNCVIFFRVVHAAFHA